LNSSGRFLAPIDLGILFFLIALVIAENSAAAKAFLAEIKFIHF
jgi:hypothetical protein